MDTIIGLSKSKEFIYGGDLIYRYMDWTTRIIWSRETKLVRHAYSNNYIISALEISYLLFESNECES